jgi:hypothetical protein
MSAVKEMDDFKDTILPSIKKVVPAGSWNFESSALVCSMERLIGNIKSFNSLFISKLGGSRDQQLTGSVLDFATNWIKTLANDERGIISKCLKN